MDDSSAGREGEPDNVEIPRHSVEIEWVYDDYDCETCGPSFAQGAIVRVDNMVVLELIPRASCWSSDTWEAEEVYNLLLERFGFDVTIKENHVNNPPPLPEDGDDENVQ